MTTTPDPSELSLNELRALRQELQRELPGAARGGLDRRAVPGGAQRAPGPLHRTFGAFAPQFFLAKPCHYDRQFMRG